MTPAMNHLRNLRTMLSTVVSLLSRPAGTPLQAGRTITVSRAAILLRQPQRSLNSGWGSPGTGERLGPGIALARDRGALDRAPGSSEGRRAPGTDRGASGRLLRSCNRALVITRLMNKPPRPPVPAGPLGRRRAPIIGVLIAIGALLVAACGSSPNNAAVANLGSTTTTNAASSQGISPPATSIARSERRLGSERWPGARRPAVAVKFRHPRRQRGRRARVRGVHAFSRGTELPRPQRPGGDSGERARRRLVDFQAAANGCRHLLPNGGQPTPAEQAQGPGAGAQVLAVHALARDQRLPRPSVRTRRRHPHRYP